ncbi:MAG TPA: hypothetical protein VFX33_00240 [Actinomycetales bacterium]|nr:hypothetical protein [Actinomycetales bacterium]
MRKSLAALAIGAVLVSAGCGDDRPDRAITIEKPSETAAAKNTEEAPANDAGKPLTKEQAEAALLTTQELPTGFSQDDSVIDDEGDDTEDVTSPEVCGKLFSALDDASAEPLVKAERGFTGSSFTILQQVVASHEKEAAGQLDAVAGALTKCNEFTSTDADGVETSFSSSSLSFPNLGDKTLAVRMKAESEGMEMTLDVISIAVGQNSISLLTGGLAPIDGSKLEEVARTAVTKLEKAAA